MNICREVGPNSQGPNELVLPNNTCRPIRHLTSGHTHILQRDRPGHACRIPLQRLTSSQTKRPLQVGHREAKAFSTLERYRNPPLRCDVKTLPRWPAAAEVIIPSYFSFCNQKKANLIPLSSMCEFIRMNQRHADKLRVAIFEEIGQLFDIN